MLRSSLWLLAIGASFLSAAPASAAPITLRLATQAPDGTTWAREMIALGREVERETRGQVILKWYFGGIAGDEIQMRDRIRRGQLDGAASGGMLCQDLAPSTRVLYLPGLLRTWAEAIYIVSQLQPLVDREFASAGFTNLGQFGFGSVLIFTRHPVSTMEALKRERLHVWELDSVEVAALAEMGLTIVPQPLTAAGRAYDEGVIDGFVALPASALAFQWSSQAHYVIDLRSAFGVGCLVLATRVLDEMSLDDRRTLTGLLAKGSARMTQIGRVQDETLLGGLFERQGLHTVPISESFRAEFFEVARRARSKLIGRLVSHELFNQVAGWLADFRAEHSKARAEP